MKSNSISRHEEKQIASHISSEADMKIKITMLEDKIKEINRTLKLVDLSYRET